MWRRGYESGELKSIVYDDVLQLFQRVGAKGVRFHIYSSGSREAQKLLFKYSDLGDLCPYLSTYFDTKVGNKRESSSYAEILQYLGADSAEEVLFASDIFEEAEAAAAVGLKTLVMVRPGNAPLPAACHHDVANSFAELL